MSVSDFGRLGDGRSVQKITISSGVMEAGILTYGAILFDLLPAVTGAPRSVVLGYDRLEDYVAQDAYFGAIAGRCANRIRGGRFQLAGETRQLSLNEGGRTHLHGGTRGFDKRLWTLEDETPDTVVLSLRSPDGEEGYPGTVDVRCTYSLDGPALRILLEAATDAPTLVNLAAHSYFALDDGPTILDHRLTVPADRWTPVGADLLPTGEIASVAGTPLDFRSGRPFRGGTDFVYDHNLVLADAPAAEPRLVARLESPATGIALDLRSTEPGLQVYDGNFLPARAPLRGGRPAVRFGGTCLEPQRFPDAINNPGFASAVLEPGQTYRQVTEYVFSGS